MKGNSGHISNLLQVLEYFSGQLDGEHPRYPLLNKKADLSRDSRDYDENGKKQLMLDRFG